MLTARDVRVWLSRAEKDRLARGKLDVVKQKCAEYANVIWKLRVEAQHELAYVFFFGI